MSMRGLVVALLCGLLGIGLGVVVGVRRPAASRTTGDPYPISAVSPSVPIDEPPSSKPPAADIKYPTLSPDLSLPPPDRTIGNELATWTYHIPAGGSRTPCARPPVSARRR